MSRDVIREPGDPEARLARSVVDRLVAAGHTAYFAGGCVRDRLMGRTPQDFDVATSATPEQVRELFGRRRTLGVGAAFGVVIVLGNNQLGKGQVEVATFRTDAPYSDGRRPDAVHYSSPEEDARRRDFTINGLFFDPQTDRVIDFVGGQADLRRRVIRAIGEADQRFAEDKLRLLRAVRFAATFGFHLEAQTERAICRHAQDIGVVSGERIAAEMRRLLGHPGAFVGTEVLHRTGLLAVLLPELQQRWTDDFPEGGCPVGEAVLRLLQWNHHPTFEVGLATCLAPAVFASPHVGADAFHTAEHQLVDQVGRRWRLASHEMRAVRRTLEHFRVLLHAHETRWSKVQPVLVDPHAESSLALATAWAQAFGLEEAGVRVARERLSWPPEQLDPPRLVSGATLAERGLRPGPLYGQLIEEARRRQLDGELRDQSEADAWLRKRLERETGVDCG